MAIEASTAEKVMEKKNYGEPIAGFGLRIPMVRPFIFFRVYGVHSDPRGSEIRQCLPSLESRAARGVTASVGWRDGGLF